MTLIELLIVMGILLVLVTLGAVNMQPEVERRRMREAARQVGVYIGSARSRAMETGRPCGVMIERVSNDPQFGARMGMVLHQVEVPPPYAGSDLNSKCVVQISGGTPLNFAMLKVFFSPPSGYTGPTFAASPIDYNLVQAGDQIQFNAQGPMYVVQTVDASGMSLDARIELKTGQWLPWPVVGDTPPWSLPMPYKILRQPQKSGAAPLQLPATVVIDLESSGTEAVPQAFSPAGPGPDYTVKIIFSGSGALEGYYAQMAAAPGVQPVYLLVGKRPRILPGGVMPEDNLYNYQDFDNYWIAVTPQGLVATHQVGTYVNNTDKPADIAESREFVRTGRSKGGG